MKRIFTVLAVFTAVGLLVAPASAATVKMGTSGGAWPSSPYIATVQTGSVGIYGAGQSFKTFCVEYHETFSAGPTYIAEVKTYAHLGGNETPTTPFDNEDALDVATSWVYRNYMTSGLSGLSTLVGGGHTYSDIDVQYVIWALEDELASGDDHANRAQLGQGGATAAQIAARQALYDKARALHGGMNYTGVGPYVIDASYNPYGVMVMNLYDSTGQKIARQSHLVLVPAPGAALLAFLGLGIVGWVKRRMA